MTLGSLDYGLVARAFEINAVGPLRLTEACLKQGLLGHGAKIALVSSKLGSVASNTRLGANYAYRIEPSRPSMPRAARSPWTCGRVKYPSFCCTRATSRRP